MDNSLPGAGPNPSRRPGRRDNGLFAAEWGALVDVDPRLSEALLNLLAAAGVAAYVEPAAGVDTFSRAARLPDRPLDRLWVDPVRADAAREVVGAEVADLTTLLAENEPGATAYGFVQPVPPSAAVRALTPPVLPDPPARPPAVPTDRPTDGPADRPTDGPADLPTDGPADLPADVPTGLPADLPAGLPADVPTEVAPPSEPKAAEPTTPEDPDAAWRQIVADYDRESDDPVPLWPVTEDVDPPKRGLRASRPERSGEEPRRAAESEPGQGSRGNPNAELPDWVEPAALDDEGHYQPPPPPPVPRLAPKKFGAIATVLFGLALLLRPSIVGLFQLSPAGVFLVGLTMVIGGAAGLIVLMRDAPDDSSPDDGAVV